MSSQCSMRTSHKMHKEHWLFSFSTSLLDATKTTIFKIVILVTSIKLVEKLKKPMFFVHPM